MQTLVYFSGFVASFEEKTQNLEAKADFSLKIATFAPY